MTTMLMGATVFGEPIPENRLIGVLLLLMIAGLDTTQSAISQSIEELAVQQERQRELRANPDRIPMMTEELLRWTAPAGPYRSAVRDTELGGVTMKKGDRVNFMVQVANRDPAEFEAPQTVDLDREVNRHMAFGLGPHKCIGAALARTVLTAALDEFHAAIPTYSLADSSSHLGGVWGMNGVEITWSPQRIPG
jgi:cytochrome P450